MSDFHVIVLGGMSGASEGNLSGFLMAPRSFQEYIACDAGSLLYGIKTGVAQGSFATFPSQKAEEILRDYVKGYLISHAHLDHIMALVINSQIDSKKRIYAFDQTIDAIRDHIFNGTIWPNQGNEGKNPSGLYEYMRLVEGKKIKIEGSCFAMTPFALNHGSALSTAFLLEAEGKSLLYCGDTTSDRNSRTKRLLPLWKQIAPLIDRGELKGMFLECSYDRCTEEQLGYGHLDAEMMMEEMGVLASQCRSLAGFKVVVTHRKELVSSDPSSIQQSLASLNHLGIDFIFPIQGQKIIL